MVLGICSNILEEMKNFQLDRFRFIVTGFISERAEQGLAYKSYAVTDTAVDDHFTNEFKTFHRPLGPGVRAARVGRLRHHMVSVKISNPSRNLNFHGKHSKFKMNDG